MSKLAKALTAAAGNAGGTLGYVEDVFSTYLYDGTGTAHTITNGIDLDGEGGLTWIKTRNTGTSAWHSLSDTERGAGYILRSDLTNAQNFDTAEFTSFNSDGFTVGNDTQTNGSGRTYASWTFRKAEKFFDVVTWTGDGVTGREIAHNLGSAPAVIIIKSVSFANNWLYNHNFGASGYDLLYLDLTNAKSSQTYASGAIQAQPTDSSFTLKNSSSVNGDGNTYVAYLFASDAGGFGDDGSESIIKCGSYTGTGGAGTPPVIDLGFEPQWLLVKNANDAGGNWMLMDTMRGWGSDGSNLGPKNLRPNTSDSEFDWGQYNYDLWTVNPTGFTVGPTDLYNVNNTTGATYIYIAIRRPMKTPESGTEVFAVDEANSGTNPNFYSGFPVDVSIRKFLTNSTQSPELETRLTNKKLETAQTAAENATDSGWWDWQDGVSSSGHGTGTFAWMFKRATGFFDVVAYTGDGVAGRTVTHNLGVAPELMIVKRRNAAESWSVYSAYNGLGFLFLNTTSAYNSANIFWNNTSPSDSVFTVSADGGVNVSGGTYIAYLFGSVAGVSKVGGYTGNGTSQTIDCGFSNGARFVLFKNTSTSDNWYVFDTVRGIVSGADPYLRLNLSLAQQSEDFIDPDPSGFAVSGSDPANNRSGNTYIFLAIA